MIVSNHNNKDNNCGASDGIKSRPNMQGGQDGKNKKVIDTKPNPENKIWNRFIHVLSWFQPFLIILILILPVVLWLKFQFSPYEALGVGMICMGIYCIVVEGGYVPFVVNGAFSIYLGILFLVAK